MSETSDKEMLYLSLGANLGEKEKTLKQAISLIGEHIGMVVKQSSFYYSKAWGFSSQNEFVNVVISVKTSLTPRKVLEKTKKIENLLGRKEKTSFGIYQDREIDIDILLYGDKNIDEPDLKIPHPLMNKREFVIIPLKEIYP